MFRKARADLKQESKDENEAKYEQRKNDLDKPSLTQA